MSRKPLKIKTSKNIHYFFYNVYLKWSEIRRLLNDDFCKFIVSIYKIVISGPSLLYNRNGFAQEGKWPGRMQFFNVYLDLLSIPFLSSDS